MKNNCPVKLDKSHQPPPLKEFQRECRKLGIAWFHNLHIRCFFPPRERQMKKKPAQKAKKQHVNDTTKTKVNQQQTNYTQKTLYKLHIQMCMLLNCVEAFSLMWAFKSYLGMKTFIIYWSYTYSGLILTCIWK